MEIAPVPHRSTRGEWGRLGLGLLVLTPVVLLVLLPAVLGLDRSVVTAGSAGGSPGRGSVVLAREEPPEDLQVGDLITFRPPGGATDERVTRRILALDGTVAVTEADAPGAADRWSVPLDSTAYSRVWLAVPWIGYPFVMGGGWALLSAAAVVALVLALAMGRHRAPPRVPAPPRTRLPVA